MFGLMKIAVGDVVKCKVTGFAKFGVFVCLEQGGQNALIHISELSDGFIKDVEAVYKVGDTVEAIVIAAENNKINLSVKQLLKNKVKMHGPEQYFSHTDKQGSFEDMMNKFKHDSEEKSHDLKKFYEGKRGSSPRRR